MAVVSVKETYKNTAGGMTGQQASHTRAFTVICDSLSDTFETARFAEDPTTGLQIPRKGAVHNTNIGLVCDRVTPSMQGDSPYVYIVQCEYVLRGAVPPDEQNDNPLLRAAKITWSGYDIQRPVIDAIVRQSTGALATVPITNSANEPLDPPPTAPISVAVLRITRNQRSFDPNLILNYRGRVNSDVFRGVPAGYWRMADIIAEDVYEAANYFWRVTYELHCHPDSWRTQYLDQGAKELIAINKPPQLILDESGAPMGQVLLNGAGRRNVPDAQGRVTPHYRPSNSEDPEDWYRELPEIPFAPLNLPNVPYP